MKPITPAQARKKSNVPAFIIGAVNDLIQENFKNDKAVVMQSAILDRALAHPDCHVTRQQICDNRWLDFEPLYAPHWDIEYEKPGYNETSKAYFTFTARSHMMGLLKKGRSKRGQGI